MRCVICDVALATPDYNRDLEAYEPCPTCLAVIEDAVGSFGDKPYAEEDQLVDDSPLNYYDRHPGYKAFGEVIERLF